MSLKHFFLIILAGVTMRSQGQIDVLNATIDPYRFGSTTFLSATLSNAASPGVIRMEGDLRNMSGTYQLTFRSRTFSIGAGIQQIVPGSYAMEFFKSSGSAAAKVSREHRLPGGEYTFCVHIIDMLNNEKLEAFCDRMIIEDLLFMDLVHPADRDTIEDQRPTLMWSLTGAVPGPDHHFRLTVANAAGGENADRALAINKPLFQIDDLRTLVVPYPNAMPSLVKGECYAWRVDRFITGMRVDRTESWIFCVKDDTPPDPVMYYLLGRHSSDAVVESLNERLYFRYDRPHDPDHLNCVVMDASGAVISTATSVHGQPDILLRGTGLYEVDLAGCGLGPGEYQLMVRFTEHRSERLRFRMEE